MSKEMNPIERLKKPTPPFFKRVIAIAMSVSAAGAALLTAPTVVDGFVLPNTLTTLAQWMVVAGIVASAIAKTTVDDNQ